MARPLARTTNHASAKAAAQLSRPRNSPPRRRAGESGRESDGGEFGRHQKHLPPDRLEVESVKASHPEGVPEEIEVIDGEKHEVERQHQGPRAGHDPGLSR